MRIRHKFGVALGLSALIWSGCAEDTSPNPEDTDTTATGIALTLDVASMEDVAALQFDISTCDGEEAAFEEVPISELEFTEEMELDVTGTAAFADYFATLEAGCYDVEMIALDEEGEMLDGCSVAMAQGVEVETGQTTEIVMVSHCGGPPTGGLDVLGVLNFAPSITQLSYDPSKIVECEAIEVCATAVDSDGDGIEFEWAQLSGPDPLVAPEVISSTEDNGVYTECIDMTPGYTGAYAFEVTAFDTMENEEGETVRVEEVLQVEDEVFASHASLAFPAYATCEEPEEDVLGEVEDDKEKKYEDEEEDVLGEVEDDKKKKYEDEEEDVLGEVEDEKKKKDEDVLGEVENCTWSFAYWQMADEWPADGSQVLGELTWYELMEAEYTKKSSWAKLAQQYVVAQLNIAAGADAPSAVESALDEASDWLESNEMTAKDRLRARDLEQLISSYNRGEIGPGACESTDE